jgi:hypothetical protein
MNQNYNFVQGLFSQVMNGKNEALATKKSTSFKGLLSLIALALFASVSMQGQTTLISPTGDGGFQTGSTFAANGWTNSSSANNPWIIGTAVTSAPFSGNSAYISNNGVANAYTDINNSSNFFWRDVTVPAGETAITLSFNWICQGESTWDNWQVFYAPTTVVPTGSTTHPGSGATNVPAGIAGATWLGNGNLQGTVQTATIYLPASLAGTTFRLIFHWKNDSGGTQPPASIDNISLISRAPGTFTSIVTGNWNSPSTWDANAVPTSVDNAIVSTGHTVTADLVTTSVNNLTVNGTLAYATACTNVAVAGNLTVASTGLINVFNSTTGKTLTVAGNITNNGRIDTSIGATTAGTLTLNGTLVQTVSGSGTFGGTTTATSSSNTAGVIRNLIINNTNSAIPNVIWSFNNVRIAYNLTLTNAKINLGSNKLIFGNYAAGNTLTASNPNGFLPGGKFSRWWTATATGTAISAGVDPTNGTSRYPFINSTGLNRAIYISRASATGAVAGELAVVYNDATTNTTGLTVTDGTYTINNRFDGNWAVSSEGTGFSSAPLTVAIIAPNTLYPSTSNARVMFANAAIGGTHQNGTSTPGAQRIAVSQLDLLAGPLYIGVAVADIPFVATTTGDWNAASTWNRGTVPTCNDIAVIADGVNVTVNSASNVVKGLTISFGGTLTVSSGDLTVGCTLNNNTLTNNGTLTVSGGTLNVNGNLVISSGSTFNQSGGNINIDGNAAGVTTNSATTALLAISSPLGTVNGGTITIVDPSAATTATKSVSYGVSSPATSISWAGHTLILGNGTSTDAGGATNGFEIDSFLNSSRLVFGNVIVNGGSGTNRFTSSSSAGGNGTWIGGTLSINSGSEWRDGSATNTYLMGNIVNNGTFTNQSATLNLAGWNLATNAAISNTNAQTISGSGVFRNSITTTTASLTSLTVNNSNATGVTLNVPLSVSGTLTMTSGKINTTSTNILRLGSATAAGTLSGTPSATNMIVGPFARTFAARTAAGTYNSTTLFPVGKGSAYTPVFIDPSIAAANAATISGEAFATNSGSAAPDVTNLSATRWEVLTTNGFANLINANVRVQEANILSTQAMVQSPTASGVYDRLPATSTYSATGPEITGSGIGAATLTASGYFAYGNVAPPQPPTVTDYSTAFSAGPNPTICANGGSVVTIIGTNLATVTSVLFTGVGSTVPNLPGTITAKTSTSVTVTAPSGLIVTGGTIVGYILVTNPVGSFQSPYHFFTSGSPTVSVTPNLTACSGANSTLTASGATTYSWAPNTALSAITGTSVTANPTTNTTYTVTGADALGCTATNTVAITVLPAPSAITITPSTVCTGSVATLVATGGTVDANASTYSFASSAGTFTPLTGGTVSAINSDDTISGAVPIGFSFNYAGNTYTNVYASSNGFLSFNASSANSAFNSIGAPAATSIPLIAPLWDDLDGFSTGAASYLTTGTAGNRVFTFEWLNWEWNYTTSAATISFQVKLYEADGKIEFVYRPDAAAVSSPTASAGLVGTTAGNYLSLSDLSATATASTTVPSNAIALKPVAGQVFTFTRAIQPVISWTSASNLFTDNTATTAYANENIRTVYSTVSGSQTYTATATAANGCSSTTTVTVTPLPLPSAPTAVGSSQCGARVPTATVAATSGAAGTGTFKWYDQQSGGTAVQTSTSTTLTSYSVSTTTTLYVSEVGVNGCESLRTPVTITVGSAPALTISAAPSAICVGGSTTTPVTITSTLADFNQYTWAPATGVTGDSTVGYTFNPTATTNYVLSSLNTTTGCTNLANLTVTVNPLPVISSATTSVEPLCLGSSTTLTGTSLLPPVSISLGAGATNSTSVGASFLPGGWGGAKTQYIIRASELTAAGLSAGIINSIGFEPTTSGQTYTGFSVSIAATSLTAMTSTFVTTGLTQVYKGTLANDGFLPVANAVNTLAFGTGTGSSSRFVWNGTSNILVSVSWSSVPDAFNSTATNMKVDSPGFTCSAYRQADAETPETMLASTSGSTRTSRPKFIFGFQNEISSSLNWSWSPAATLSSATGNVVIATPTASTVYTVTATNPTTTCSATSTVSVTILPTLASAPTATTSTHCGLQLSTATVTSTTTTVNPVFVWYTVATGGTSVQSGPSNTFLTAINSTRTMYVAEIGPNGCESLRTPVVMTVNAPPVVSITSSVPTFCGTGGNATLTANSADPGMTYTWTSLTPSATLSALNTSVVTASVSETSEFKVVGIATDTSCLPIESFISVGVYPLPSATVTTTAQGLCPGSSATIGSGLTAGNFTADCIPAPSAPATSPANAISLVGGGALLTPYPAGVTANSTSLDDNFWSGIPVGFNFNFFGNTVTNVFIGSNGTINLGTAGSTAFTFTGGFPSTSSPASTVAVVARDLHWNRTGSGKITYWTEGVAPNRRFVVQFLNATTYATDFTTGLPSGKQTAEVVFYETLGTIDIRVFEASFTNAKYIGLQDGTQTIGATAPNCNVTPNTPNYWNGVTAEIPTTAPRAWRFTPPSSYATTWSANGVVMPSVTADPTATPPVVGYANPGTNVFSIPVAPLATTTYSISYTNLTSGCSNTPGSAQVVMGVLGNVAPVGVNTIVNNSTICLGQSVNFSTSYTGLPDGIAFQWQNSIDGGTTWNDIASATSLTLTHTPLAPSKYRLKMVACNGTPGYTSEASIGFFNNVVSSTPAVRCGVGTATLTAAGSTDTTIKWYANQIGGSSIGTGTTFTTPSISTSTTYYAGAEKYVAGALPVGAGGTNSISVGRSFLSGGWGGTKTQFIIKASELIAAGIGAGNITSLGFEPTDSGQTYQGFFVSLAPVTANVMTTTFISTGLTQVYAGVEADNGFTPVANTLNNLTFGTGTGSASAFNWDGSSNILVTISRSSVPGAFNSTGTTMKVDDVGFVSTAYDQADNLTPAAMLASATADATTTFRPKFTINGQVVCSSARVAVPVTVTPPPAITLSGNPATICAEYNSTPVTVTAGASDYSSYVWTPTTVTGNATTGWVFNPLTTTTYTLLASQTTGTTPCANTATITVAVNPTPTVLTIAPVSTCANAITPIVATGGTLDNMTILSQNFNGVTNDWTTVNNSTGGTPSLANWTLQQSGYVYSFYGPFASNDNSQFYMTNSDAQGFGGTTATELKSPVFSTVGFSVANLSFFHYLNFPTTAVVEYTVDGGTTWASIQSYTNTQGAVAAFSNVNLALPAAMLNQPTVQLRFRYGGSWDYFWAIDNVSIIGTQVAPMLWSPTTNLYTDAAATIPYTGQNLSTVYFKNTNAASTVNYTATATSMLGCARVATVPVVVYQTAAPTGSQFYQFCPSGAATVSSMSPVLIGTNIKWYTTSTGGTALAPTTPLTQGYYWASQTANGCESPTRYLVFAISNATAAPSSNPSQQFCNSATVANLTANGSGLQWYSAATGGTALISTAALSTGTYYVSQTSGGCESPRTAVSVTVTSVPAPTGAATQSLSSLLTLGDIVVTGSNITWYASAANAASGTNPLPSTQLLANTTYYATQTINGCRSAASLAVTITTLANQDFDMTQFTYYPNPVMDLLNITYSQDMTSVKVFNMVGQQLMSKQVNSNTIQVDMSNYANGAYFIQVTTENAMKTVRVIKK